MNLHRHFLQTSARGRYEANATLPYPVGETESLAIYYGGAAVRPHHKKPLRLRHLLEPNFILQSDIIAKHHDMKSLLKGQAGFAGSILAGSRNND